MSRVTPTQTNFNAGELSRRLHGRFDLNLYTIGVAELTAWVPLVEGGVDACPGTIHVAPAGGPCRLVPFEPRSTQGYVIEMRGAESGGLARFYTNDARIEDEGEPIELALPWSLEQIRALTWEQSYDVLYLFHGEHQTRELTRTGADSFELNMLELENGPFEERNKNEAVTVAANAVTGTVTLIASAAIFAATDEGSLFQMEADDFGDITAWEPGITVTVNQLLTWNERVYGVVGGSGRTGTLAPVHGKGVEWDGIGTGKDLNDKNAGGVQLEYLCDRFGIVRITEFVSATEVMATVLRRLPFTTSGSYTGGGGGYWIGGEWVPPEDAVTYAYGTWRWRFGSFSDTRGWPECGVVWNERLCLFKQSTGYCSVAGDLKDFASYNELGEISADMAFTFTIKDPNPIEAVIGDEKLLMLTAGGMWALGPSNAAAGVGPDNFRVDRQNNEGAAPGMAVELDGRFIYIGKSRRRIIEASYGVERNRQDSIDLTRYARHIGARDRMFEELVAQKDPNRLVWARRSDGTLALAAYVPEEDVLGWATRPLATGVAARSICGITDPTGTLGQLWAAVTWNDDWHVVRLAPFREEGDADDPAMTDLAVEYEGEPATLFGPVPWLADATIHVQAAGESGPWAAYADIAVDEDGMFTLPNPATRVIAGLPFPCRLTTLPVDAGGDNGPAMGKKRRISRLVINVLKALGLRVSVQGADWLTIEQMQGDSVADAGFVPDTGILIREDTGTDDRFGQVTIERYLPQGATIRAIQPTVEVRQR